MICDTDNCSLFFLHHTGQMTSQILDSEIHLHLPYGCDNACIPFLYVFFLVKSEERGV